MALIHRRLLAVAALLLTACATHQVTPSDTLLRLPAPSQDLRSQLEALLQIGRDSSHVWLGWPDSAAAPLYLLDPFLHTGDSLTSWRLPSAWTTTWTSSGLVDGLRTGSLRRTAVRPDTILATLYLPDALSDTTVTAAITLDFTVPNGSADCGYQPTFVLLRTGAHTWAVSYRLYDIRC